MHVLDTGRVKVHRSQGDPHPRDSMRLLATLVDYGDGAIRLLATPRHTAGHQSVLVTPSEGPRVLIAGDALYSEAALIARRIDGVGVAPDLARASIDRLREICREAPTVVAPTHDTAAAERVAASQVTPL